MVCASPIGRRMHAIGLAFARWPRTNRCRGTAARAARTRGSRMPKSSSETGGPFVAADTRVPRPRSTPRRRELLLEPAVPFEMPR